MNLNDLNPAQKQAVLDYAGPIMILAGAGSGKTKTLVTKIQYLLEEKNVSPHQLLAVTFSNKAAREMRERVSRLSNHDLGALQITTFHSFCAKVLRLEAQYIGLSRNFTIYDSSEQKAIIKTILGKRGISSKEIHPSEVQYFIEDIKNSGHYVDSKDEDEFLDDIDKDDLFYEFYLEYEAELHRSNAVDFGGLITGVLNLFDSFPEVLNRYQKRFHYLLVDEYQDTNRAQFKLIRQIANHYKNICVVGDEDQSIYSWRGADIRNILDFEKVYPNSKIIKLEQNYRSSKIIIDAATHVISKNTQRKGKQMWTDNEIGEHINIIECNDDRSEARFIAKEVNALIKKGVDPLEIAIFYRTNAQSRVIEDALRENRIPYRVIAGIKFYERKEIKDVLGYLRLIVNPKDSLALSRVINTPTRGIGVKTLRKLEEEAIKQDISLWELLVQAENNPEEYKFLKLSAKIKKSLGDFVTTIEEAKILNSKGEPGSDIYEKILHESGYYGALASEKNYESQARLENLEELLNAIKQFEIDSENPTLSGFLETITLDTNVLESEEETREVSMMTIHGSKGLEYHYVFVGGIEESVFPSFQSLEEGESAIEEERRLFYVAMTRAMKKLYLLFAQGRMLWGSLKFNGPSRFIDEIPEEYYEWNHYKGVSLQKKSKNTSESYDEFNQDSQYNEEPVYYANSSSEKAVNPKKFPKGSLVKHRLYGNGKIIENNGIGKSEKVVILFNDGAKKKFMVEFAPIEKV